MPLASEQPISTIPRDGRWVNVRVGRRWFKGFFGEVVGRDDEGARVWALLGGDEPRPVTAEGWMPRGEAAVGSRQSAVVAQQAAGSGQPGGAASRCERPASSGRAPPSEARLRRDGAPREARPSTREPLDADKASRRSCQVMEEAGHQAAASVERAAEGPKGPRAVARLSARAEIAVEQASRNSCHITFDQVAQRITRALLTCKYMADPEFRFLAAGSRVAWPQYVYDGEDRKAQAENQSNLDAAPPRFRPTARDLSQLDEAMAWFRVMNLDAAACAAAVRAGKLPLSPDQRLIWWRATGRSTATVARYLGVSDETARRRTNAAYARLHAIAERAARDALSRARRLACGEPAAARREHSAASLGRAARGAAAAGA